MRGRRDLFILVGHPISFIKKGFKKGFTYMLFFVGLQMGSHAQSGQALDFVPTLTNYVELRNLLPSGSYTKEAWIYARNLTDFGNDILSGTASALWAPDAYLCAGHFANNNYDYWAVSDAVRLLENTWYHVAVTYNSSTNEIILYKNGMQVDAAITEPYAETNLFVGSYNYGLHFGVGWAGLIDEVRIWNVVRTPAEIAATYNCSLTNDEPHLVAHYDFEQGIAGGNNSGVTTLLDKSKKCIPNDGMLVNFTLTGSTSNWVSPGVVTGGPCSASFPNIKLEGNSLYIEDGDGSPESNNLTDFAMGSPNTKTFTINNVGGAVLNVSGITISGPNASEFSITSSPGSTVLPGGSTTFNITFTASSQGEKTATITVNSDDPDEASYDFGIKASYSFTLPVKLKSFIVKKESRRVVLNWITSSEHNNQGFEIQRSKEGTDWTGIGFVNGRGNSDLEQMYNFYDDSPGIGKNYYRLKQIDFDHKFTFSETRLAIFSRNNILVYPTPTTGLVTIELNDSKLLGSFATLSDQQGRKVMSVIMTKMKQQISVSSLADGIYFLSTEEGTFKIVKE